MIRRGPAIRSRRWLCLALPLLAACQDKPATQVLISLATDMDAPPLQRIKMDLERFVEEQQAYMPIDADVKKDWIIATPPTGYELPGSLVTFADGEKEPKIRVTVHAHDPSGGAMLRRQAIFRLVREKTLFLRMGLTARCLDNADCPADKTCIEGRCRDPEIKRLPIYNSALRPEFTIQCASGTEFRNTTTKLPLTVVGSVCPDKHVCIEGSCYPEDVFGPALPAPQQLTVTVQLSDLSGMPVLGAELRPEDGPVSLVRRLRTDDTPAAVMPAAVTSTSPGLYQLQITTAALTTEVKLTVSAPNFAPQVLTIPVKPRVTQYHTPAVLFPLTEVTVAPGETRELMVQGGGRSATLQVPVNAPAPVRLRYSLMDGRYLPGQPLPSGAGGLLQAVSVMYLEHVGLTRFPAGTQLTLGTSSTALVVGAEGGAGAYALDLQGHWKRPAAGAFDDAAAPRLRPPTGGFWAVANLTPKPACVRGRILRPGRVECPGARVRLLGPEGVSSSDSTGADGSFCAAAAQQEAAILAVGNSTEVIYVPATNRTGAHCGLPDACTDLGEILLAEAQDCDRPPLVLAGRRQPGETCTSTAECAGLASCHGGFCVGESYARVSMSWTVRSDFDLHVKLPSGQLINERSREVKGEGRMDVEQCATQCLGDRHLENVVLPGAPGRYEVWVQNFGGAVAGTATLDIFVAGKRREVTPAMVTVPGVRDAKSEVLTFTLP